MSSPKMTKHTVFSTNKPNLCPEEYLNKSSTYIGMLSSLYSVTPWSFDDLMQIWLNLNETWIWIASYHRTENWKLSQLRNMQLLVETGSREWVNKGFSNENYRISTLKRRFERQLLFSIHRCSVLVLKLADADFQQLAMTTTLI